MRDVGAPCVWCYVCMERKKLKNSMYLSKFFLSPQMNVFEENPFFWSPSSKQINTIIISFILGDENKQELSIKHSKLPVSKNMPVKLLELGQINDTSIQQHVMHYHKVRVERTHTYLELMSFSPQAHTAIFDIYFNNGDKPSPFN